MAGNYPNAPSNRMLLDRDGAQMYKIDGATNVVTQLTSGQVAKVNNESTKVFGTDYLLHGQGQTATLLVFFPEKRDLAGYYYNTLNPVTINAVEVSTNTTNGVDGTWTAVTAAGYGEPVSPNFRTKIQGLSQLGIRAIRLRSSVGAPSFGNLPTLHLYGNPSSGQNPDRLAVWHPSSDAHINGYYYDWGDTPRSSSADRTCRIKNMSATLTAEAITVAVDALTDTTPSVPGQYLISENGVDFDATADIGDLSPGGISAVLTVRRNTPTDAALSVWEPRIIASALSWT